MRRAALLVLEHALGVRRVRQGTEGEQHDGQARTADARREGRSGSARSRRSRSRPEWHPRRSSRSSSRRARRGRARSRCSSRSAIDDLLLHAVEQRRRRRRWRRTARRRRCAARSGSRRDRPSPSRCPAWPPGCGRPSPCAPAGRRRPRRSSTPMREQEHGVAVEVEERARAQPLRLDAHALRTARDPGRR